MASGCYVLNIFYYVFELICCVCFRPASAELFCLQVYLTVFYHYFCLVHTVQVDYGTKAQGLENSEIRRMLFIYCLKITIYLLY